MTIDLNDLFPQVKDLDDKSIFALFRAIKSHFDPATFDYIKFRQSVSALIQMSMDESVSYKSAFATASTMGLTKEKLLKSANRYFSVLEDERESFATALLQQKKVKIEGRKSEVSNLGLQIEKHKQKIQELEREIEIFQKRIDNVDQDVDLATQKIEGTKTKFLDVYNVLSQEIKKDIDTINLHL